MLVLNKLIVIQRDILRWICMDSIQIQLGELRDEEMLIRRGGIISLPGWWSLLFFSLSDIALKGKLCSCNGIKKNHCVGGQRTTLRMQCRGVVADVEVASLWSCHPPLTKKKKKKHNGIKVRTIENEEETEHIYINYIWIISSPSGYQASELRHAKPSVTLRQVPCSNCDIQTLFCIQYAGTFCDWNLRWDAYKLIFLNTTSVMW